MNISNLLTNEQRIIITNIIAKQCCSYKEVAELEEGLFYKPNEKSRKQHTMTTAVISGFRPDTEVPGFEIAELPYGLYVQPELMSERLVLHIYSGDNPLGTQTVLGCCEKYNKDVSGEKGSDPASYPIFGYIKFWTNGKNDLTRIALVVPDANGNEIEKFELFKRPRVVARSA